MMLALLAAAVGLLPGPAAADARPVVSLSATPSRLALGPDERARLELRNFGPERIVVTASAGHLALDLRGRPRVARVSSRSAAAWLRMRPRVLSLAPGERRALELGVAVPRRASPGDHHALVLLATRTAGAGVVGVRMRLGVRVLVRAPGAIVRRLGVRSLRVRAAGRRRVLELTLVNGGNVTESLPRGRLVLAVRRRGRLLARLPTSRRELLPATRAVLSSVYRGSTRGVVEVLVELDRRALQVFRVRL